MDSLKDRVEELERAFDERGTEDAYGRCFGLLTAVLVMLTFLPYSEDFDDIAWSIPSGPAEVKTLGTFSVMALAVLLFLLVCGTVRPARSPWPGRLTAGFAVVLGVINWIIALNLRHPSFSADVLIVVAFLAAALGTFHALSRKRALSVRVPGEREGVGSVD